jgi:thiol-disulfide isomerase/thioredoxin
VNKTELHRPASAKRRWLLGASVAAGAGLAGWWVGEQRYTPSDNTAADALSAWRRHPYTDLQGNALQIADFSGHHVLVNFWATWCPPCVHELPLLEAFWREHQSASWKVIGIAVDQAQSVAKFLQKQPLSFPIVLGGASALQHSKVLGNLAGGLPFSLLLAPDGQVLLRKLGQIHEDELQEWRAISR